MRWMAKKFFWSMVLSCVSLVLIQFIPGGKEKQRQVLSLFRQSIQNQKMHNSEGSFEFRHGAESSERKLAAQEDKRPNTIESMKNNMADEMAKTLERLSGSDDDGLPDTVVINGVIYPRSPDNIYEIDGQRIMYKPSINMAAQRDTASDKKEIQNIEESNGDLNMNPLDMMKNLQEAKSKMNERNKYLDQLQDEI